MSPADPHASAPCVEITGVRRGESCRCPTTPWRSLSSSDQVSARLDELQISLIEGPGVDAHNPGTHLRARFDRSRRTMAGIQWTHGRRRRAVDFAASGVRPVLDLHSRRTDC